MNANRKNFPRRTSTRNSNNWKLKLGASCMTFALSATALAVEFRVTWLTNPNDPKSLGFAPNPDIHGTMGINNEGQVVYGHSPNDVFNNIRPFVWLPAADYGFVYPGWYDINEILNEPSIYDCELSLPAIARDLNDEGLIVGQSDGILSAEPLLGLGGDGVATVWAISSGLACTTTISTVEGGHGGDRWSGAWGNQQ